MESEGLAKIPKKTAKNALVIIGLLFALPPLLFWITVGLKFGGGDNLLSSFWSLLPSNLLKPMILLLPIPSLLIGLLAFWWIKRRKSGGLPLAATLIAISLSFLIFCAFAALRPN